MILSLQTIPLHADTEKAIGAVEWNGAGLRDLSRKIRSVSTFSDLALGSHTQE